MKTVKETDCFKYVNVNPSGRKVADCVIRSIANAEGKTWDEIFDSLVEIGKSIKAAPTEKEVYTKYLEKYPTIPVKFTNEFGERHRLTPELFKNPHVVSLGLGLEKGVYIVSQASHFTCVRDGIVEDIWDCSNKSTYKIWRIK